MKDEIILLQLCATNIDVYIIYIYRLFILCSFISYRRIEITPFTCFTYFIFKKMKILVKIFVYLLYIFKILFIVEFVFLLKIVFYLLIEIFLNDI